MAVLLLSIGIAVLFVALSPPKISAEQGIRQSLQEAEDAGKARNANRVMNVISEDFQAGMWNKKRLYIYLLRAMRQGRGMDYDVHVNKPRILPAAKDKPTQRVVISKVSAFYTGTGEDIWGSGAMTLVMRQETRRKWIFFEEPVWRIVSIANIPPLPAEDLAGY